jgi:membrane protease YdiL (CAAX protease family)
MTEATPSVISGDSPRLDADPRQLAAEAVSLGAILLATLTLAALERRGFVHSQGYASSLVLLVLSIGHWWWFGIDVSLLPKRRGGQACVLLLGTGLAGSLLGCAWLLSDAQFAQSSVQPLHMLLLVPLAEELYFRGLLLNHLRRAFNPAAAVVLCSLLFAGLHYDVGAMTATGILSLIGCVLVLTTGSLACAVQLHVAWNCLSQFKGLSEPVERLDWAILAAAIIMALAFGGLKYLRRPTGGDST